MPGAASMVGALGVLAVLMALTMSGCLGGPTVETRVRNLSGVDFDATVHLSYVKAGSVYLDESIAVSVSAGHSGSVAKISPPNGGDFRMTVMAANGTTYIHERPNWDHGTLDFIYIDVKDSGVTFSQAIT